MLNVWQSMKEWWATVLQANAGDVLVTKNNQGQLHYNQFQGTKESKDHPDQLTGIQGLADLPTIGNTKQQNNGDTLASLATATHVALARYDFGNAFAGYWSPDNGWTAHFVNVGLFAAPKPGETRPNVGNMLTGALLAESTALLGEAGSQLIEWSLLETLAAPLAVASFGTGVVFVGAAAWAGFTGYNVLLTPSEWSEW